MARKRIAEETKGIGKPKVGGPFDLVDQDGKRFTSDDMAGKYALVRIPSHEEILDTVFAYFGRAGASGGLGLSGGYVYEDTLTLCFSGLFWLHALPRHLPRRTRQNVSYVRQSR